MIAYFATKPVFFERNIGIALLALLVFVAVNIRNRLEMSLLAASCVLMLYWSLYSAFSFGAPNQTWKWFERDHFGFVVLRGWPIEGLDAFLQKCEGIFGVMDYNDDHSQKMIQDSKAVPIAHFKSVFAPLPTSTMHTYLESDVYYYLCAKPSSGHRPDSVTVPGKN
jgi:hypothetical protein